MSRDVGGHDSPASTVLVVVAHPDDEVLGFAGVVANAREQGRHVRVAVVTNGDWAAAGRTPFRVCGARRGRESRVARYGLRRNRETIESLSLLGLEWSLDPRRSDVFFLGYPNSALQSIARDESPSAHARSGLQHTYAYAGGRARCGGDLRSLLDGRPSALRAADLAGDVDALLELTEPKDVYTHVSFDGHPDHAETHRQLVAALERAGASVTLHSTLIHPEGTGERMADSAREWPNPSEAEVGTPFERFTPQHGFEAPPTGDQRRGWGPLGAPDELVDVPQAMLEPDPARNLKWQAIARHRSQILCRPDSAGIYHASCGYMRAFVKRHEFFWTRRL
jgi:LmbE family N-acetylglucosaminyl deacetylase